MPCLAGRRPDWIVKKGAPVYSSWRNDRTKIGKLTSRQKLVVLAGIDIVRQPDKILVTKGKPDLGLNPGDTILRYQIFGEGEASIWAKGNWYDRYSLWSTIESNGCAVSDGCDSLVIENGIREQWIQIETETGLTGWVLDRKFTRGVLWDSGVFGQLCAG